MVIIGWQQYSGRADPAMNAVAETRTWQSRKHFSNLLLFFNFVASVQTVALVSCSQLTRVGAGVVIWCFNRSASINDELSFQRCSSARLDCYEWLFEFSDSPLMSSDVLHQKRKLLLTV